MAAADWSALLKTSLMECVSSDDWLFSALFELFEELSSVRLFSCGAVISITPMSVTPSPKLALYCASAAFMATMELCEFPEMFNRELSPGKPPLSPSITLTPVV